MRLPWAILSTIAAMIALAALRVWFVEGLLRRVTIDGPSMAPVLCGAHYDVTCGDCGFPFRIDAEHPPESGNAACPNCGFGDNPLERTKLRPPERVLIDRWPLFWRQARRGEVVAAREPGSSGQFVVKRVAAIPPEQLAIQGGDLYADGRLLRKSLAELHAIRVLVHDNDHAPRKSPDLSPRWRGASEKSRWRSSGNGFQIAGAAADDGEFDWLEYQHWPCTADQRLRGVLGPVRDNDSYNQGTGPRELNIVHDVVVSCRLRITGSGQLALAAVDDNERLVVIIEPGRRIVVRSGERTLIDRLLAAKLMRRDALVEFGLCDQQVLLAIEGQTLFQLPYAPSAARGETPHPLSIGVRGLAAQVANLRVWRDVHYLDPHGLPRPWRANSPLAFEQVALLGDNQPVSTDSRHWEPSGVARGNVLGCVYRPFWASR